MLEIVDVAQHDELPRSDESIHVIAQVMTVLRAGQLVASRLLGKGLLSVGGAAEQSVYDKTKPDEIAAALECIFAYRPEITPEMKRGKW